jgi:4a-hydroxytetrahydrobiopterin dehydratase
MDPKQLLTEEQVKDAGLEDEWEVAGKALVATYATGDFLHGLRFVNEIGTVAETANHHPDLNLTYPSVTVVLTSHDVDGITSRDVDLAGRISRIAQDLRLPTG